MDIFLFIISYILLDIVGSVFYVGLLLMSFSVLGKVFKMNEDKWNVLFKFGKGIGFYLLMLFPYVVMLVVMFGASEMWFDMIHFNYNVLGSVSVVILLTIFMIFAFPKLKRIVNDKVQENY